MNDKQMRESSKKKVQQVLDLMQLLHIRVEAKQKINMGTGVIENAVVWIDEEDYPVGPKQPTLPITKDGAPAGETHKTDEQPA